MSGSLAKSDLRAYYAACRQAIPPDERAAMERAICQKLWDLPAWKHAPVIAGYMSIRGELDMLPLWRAAIDQGKSYALPHTVTGTAEGRMVFHRLDAYVPEALVPARFGIPEPTDAHPVLSPSAWEGGLLLVPGLAFDDRGFRVGYGGGYYDRFLAHLRAEGISVTAVGLVFSACRTRELPHEEHDIPVDYIIDERRITAPYGTP